MTLPIYVETNGNPTSTSPSLRYCSPGQQDTKLEAPDPCSSETRRRLERSESRASAAQDRAYQLERQLEDALRARKAAEQDAATFKARSTAAQRSLDLQKADSEEAKSQHVVQIDRKTAETDRLKASLQRRSTEIEGLKRDLQLRDDRLAAVERGSNEKTLAVSEELKSTRERLGGAERALSRLEADNADLRGRHASLLRDTTSLREALSASEAERRGLKERERELMEKLQAAVAAVAQQDSAKLAVSEAVREAQLASSQCASLEAKIDTLKAALAAEQSAFSRLKEKAQRKLDAAAGEVATLKSKLEGKDRQLTLAQELVHESEKEADARVAEAAADVTAVNTKIKAVERELQAEKRRVVKCKEEAEEAGKERIDMELAAQALKYDRRVQELELQLSHLHCSGSNSCGGGGCVVGPSSVSYCATHAAVTGCSSHHHHLSKTSCLAAPSLLDYIPRNEATRMMEARLVAREAECNAAAAAKLAATEREWSWRLESKESEAVAAAERLLTVKSKLAAVETDHAAAVAVLEADKANLTEQCNKLKGVCIELKAGAEETRSELTHLHREMEEQGKSAAATERQHQREIAGLGEKLKATEEELLVVTGLLTAAQRRIQGLTGDVDRLNGEKDRYATEALSASERSASEKSQRTAVEGEVTELRSQLRELIVYRGTIHKKLDALEEDRDGLKRDLNTVQQTVVALKTKWSCAKSGVEQTERELMEQLSGVKRALKETDMQLQHALAEKGNKSKALMEANNIAAELSQRLAAEQRRCRQIEEEAKQRIAYIHQAAEVHSQRDAEQRVQGEAAAAATAAATERRLRDAAVAPLESEVARLRARLADVQKSHALELAALESSAGAGGARTQQRQQRVAGGNGGGSPAVVGSTMKKTGNILSSTTATSTLPPLIPSSSPRSSLGLRPSDNDVF